MSYYVGVDLIRVKTLDEALEIAVKSMPSRRLGDSVTIRRGRKPKSPVFARVKVLYDREDSCFRYVYFSTKSKYGYTVTVDYHLDENARWFNAIRQ